MYDDAKFIASLRFSLQKSYDDRTYRARVHYRNFSQENFRVLTKVAGHIALIIYRHYIRNAQIIQARHIRGATIRILRT